MSTQWVSLGCTLPAGDQPLRVAEFDDLFAAALCGVERLDPSPSTSVLGWKRRSGTSPPGGRVPLVLHLAVTVGDGGLRVAVGVPSAHVDVLDALAARAVRVSGLGA